LISEVMTPLSKTLLDRVASWPDEDIAELEELTREIEARRAGVYECHRNPGAFHRKVRS
jgi:hypothetical protein